MFILWVGWYGFNAGSVLGIVGVDGTSPELVGKIAVNTTLSGCASAITVMIWRWVSSLGKGKANKVDLSTILNGLLGGLVGITGSCNVVDPWQSLFIGIFSALCVILGIKLLYQFKIDDAVEAFPVHGLCGFWGGLASAFFGGKDFSTQLIGSVAIPLWSFFLVLLIFWIMSKLIMVRVSEEEEIRGLDYLEHGEYSYTYLEKRKENENE